MNGSHPVFWWICLWLFLIMLGLSEIKSSIDRLTTTYAAAQKATQHDHL